MRRTMIIGLVIGAVSGTFVIAVYAAGACPKPPEMTAAVTAPRIPGGSEESPVRVYEWKGARRDCGPGRDVAAVKAAVSRMLDLELDAQAMPASLPARAATAAQRKVSAVRVVEQMWVPQAAAIERAETLDALDSVETDASFSGSRAGRFVISEWQGVGVHGDRAAVVLLGHSEFGVHGSVGWSPGRKRQVQAELVRTGRGVNGWQFVSKGFIFDKNAGG